MLTFKTCPGVIPPDPLAGRGRPRLRNPRPGVHPTCFLHTPNIDSLENTVTNFRHKVSVFFSVNILG